jgi:hypothetical protein
MKAGVEKVHGRGQSDSQRPPCSWTFQKSEVKGGEYQHDSYIHRQPFPELVPEEQEIYTDDNGWQQQYVKYGGRLRLHFSSRSNLRLR